MYNYSTAPPIFNPSEALTSRKHDPSAHLMLPPSDVGNNKGYLLSPLDSTYRPLGSFVDDPYDFGSLVSTSYSGRFLEDPPRHENSDFSSNMSFTGFTSDESLIFNPSTYNPAISIPDTYNENNLIQTPSFYGNSGDQVNIGTAFDSTDWQGLDDYGTIYPSLMSPYVPSHRRRRAANVFNSVGLLETCGIISDTESDAEEEEESQLNSNEETTVTEQVQTCNPSTVSPPPPPAITDSSSSSDEEVIPTGVDESPRRRLDRLFINSSSPKSASLASTSTVDSSNSSSSTPRKTSKRSLDQSPRQALQQRRSRATRSLPSSSSAGKQAQDATTSSSEAGPSSAPRRTTSGKTVKEFTHPIKVEPRSVETHDDTGLHPLTQSDSSSLSSSTASSSSPGRFHSSDSLYSLSPLTQPGTPLPRCAVKRDREEAELDEEPGGGGDDDEYDPAEDESMAKAQLPQRRSTQRRRKRGSGGSRKKGASGPKPSCQHPGCRATFTREADLVRHQTSVHSQQTIEEVMRETRVDYRLWCLGCRKILARPDARSRHEEGCQKYLEYHG